MTKRFCDLCGRPETGIPIVTRPQVTRHGVIAHIWFSKDQSPAGFFDPPDLCKNCMLGLIYDLKKEFERE